MLNIVFSPLNQGIIPEHVESYVAYATTLHTVAFEQTAQVVAFPVIRAKLVSSPD